MTVTEPPVKCGDALLKPDIRNDICKYPIPESVTPQGMKLTAASHRTHHAAGGVVRAKLSRSNSVSASFTSAGRSTHQFGTTRRKLR